MNIFSKSLFTRSFIVLALLISIPFSASASTTKPTCSLSVTTPEGTAKIHDGENVLLHKESVLQMTWKSDHAKKAVDGTGHTIPFSGTATSSPLKTTTYTYSFSSGTKKAVCKVTATVVTGSIDEKSLSSHSSKPTLSGKASGIQKVRMVLHKKDVTTVLSTKTTSVRNEKWKAKISKKLSDGLYDVEILGGKDIVLGTVATGTLAIGDATENTKSNTTLVVETIPLLSGGIAHKGTAVSISYLQVTNIGKETATVNGFYLKQNGSASTDAVIGLTTVDDKGGSRGSVGGTENDSPFKNRTAFVPTHATIPAGQMLLFTIKAITTNNIAQHAGTQLKIDVTGVDANSTLKGVFPIRGTTWTLAN